MKHQCKLDVLLLKVKSVDCGFVVLKKILFSLFQQKMTKILLNNSDV